MHGDSIRSVVRRRLLFALPGLAAFLVLGFIVTDQTWHQPWLSIGLGMALSAVFVEPYFATPRAAIVNGAAAVLALVAIDRTSVEGLWVVMLAIAAMVCIAGLVATIGPPGVPTAIAQRIATRFGRAVVLGTPALLLIVLSDAVAGRDGFELMAIGTAVLTASLAVDWAGLFTLVRQREELGSAVAAIGPRMILVAADRLRLAVGDGLEVRGPQGAISGNVVYSLPHASGVRYQIALTADWTSIGAGFPQDVGVLRSEADERRVVGAVAEGSTQKTIQFEPTRPVEIGSSVILDDRGATVLYQVAHQRLVRSSWKGAEAVVPQATARLVGWPEPTRLRGGSHLPSAHEPVLAAIDLSGSLEEGVHLVGHVIGTTIPIGLRVDRAGGSHIAVLGMSGMGKTIAATRLCNSLATDRLVIAVDTTGEYASRLGFGAWTPGDFDTPGRMVYEPAGSPPQKAAEFIEQCMTAGHSEYSSNAIPANRIIVLEEAHSFVPEFPLALRDHQPHIAKSTRFVMQSRKLGITFIMVSQRTAVVSKSALSQCENYIILKTLDKTSLEYFESLVGQDIRDAIPGLGRYEAVCVGPAFNADEPVLVHLAPP
jgi:hypothetical protein